MVPKLYSSQDSMCGCFRAVLFRMVPKPLLSSTLILFVLELCCFEWFQNLLVQIVNYPIGFRAVLFRMVPKHKTLQHQQHFRFRAVLFRMVPKPTLPIITTGFGFRAVLFRMVPKPFGYEELLEQGFRAVLFRMVPKRQLHLEKRSPCFRAVLFRMVPKPRRSWSLLCDVLELCCFEWFQNLDST